MAETLLQRILVIKDDPGYLELLETILAPIYDLSVCETVEVALQKISSEKFDLILSDINLQDKSGLVILMTMRKNDLLKGCPLVLCSSQTDEGTKQIAHSMGAAGFIDKPFKYESLLEQIALLLKKT